MDLKLVITTRESRLRVFPLLMSFCCLMAVSAAGFKRTFHREVGSVECLMEIIRGMGIERVYSDLENDS